MRAGPRRSLVWLAVVGLLPLVDIAVETPRALSIPPQDGFEAQGVFRDPLASQPILAATAAPTVARAPNASFVGVLGGTVTFGPGPDDASGGFTGHPAVFLGGGGNCLDVTVVRGRPTDGDPERVAELVADFRIHQCAGGTEIDVLNVLVQVYRTGLMSAGPASSGNTYPTPRPVPTSVTSTSVPLPTLPTTTVSADPLHDGELIGTMFSAGIVSPCPDMARPLDHCRDEGVLTGSAPTIVAARPDDGTGRRHVLQCISDQGGNITFRGRQDFVQGRGFIDPSDHIVASGLLLRDENDDAIFGVDEVTSVTCRISIGGGIFHRVGTVVHGSLRVDVHTTGDPASDPFRHHYCVRLEGTYPLDTFGLVQPSMRMTGRVAGCDGPPDAIHNLGRTSDDNPEHG